jgi:hypothetical protein
LRQPARPFAFAVACAWGLLYVAEAVVDASAAEKPAIRTVVIESVKYEPEALTV